jgi:tRNA pseudouridine55 synthase
MDGVLIIDKPAGLTSHDVVARVRQILREKRVGHTGTLDPFATGVLVVLVGRATRLAQFLSGADKQYEAVIRLGYATDTGDITGTPRVDEAGSEELAPLDTVRADTPVRPDKVVSAQEIEAALASLRGEIDQVPPMYSAKKQQGRKLYELARRGEEVERKPVRVIINEFEAVQRGGSLLTHNDDGTCDLAVRVVCSAGTYVRTLAEDFGRCLGTGAHLAALCRTRAGEFKIDNAITLAQLQDKTEAGALASILLSPDAALARLPFLHLSAADARRTRHGMSVQPGVEVALQWSEGERVRMRDEAGNLIAIGFYDAVTQILHPRVVVAEVE